MPDMNLFKKRGQARAGAWEKLRAGRKDQERRGIREMADTFLGCLDGNWPGDVRGIYDKLSCPAVFGDLKADDKDYFYVSRGTKDLIAKTGKLFDRWDPAMAVLTENFLSAYMAVLDRCSDYLCNGEPFDHQLLNVLEDQASYMKPELLASMDSYIESNGASYAPVDVGYLTGDVAPEE